MDKYKLWYDALIDKAKIRNWTKKTAPCYVERHHIIPKSLGGTNEPNNIVCLTAREHCVAHLFLCRFGSSDQKSKMIWALQRFLSSNKTVSSTLYESSRLLWIEEHRKKLIGNKRRLGKKDTLETRLKKQQSMKGVVGKWNRESYHRELSSKRISKINSEKNPMLSEKSRKKVSASKLGRKRIYREDGTFYMSAKEAL